MSVANRNSDKMDGSYTCSTPKSNHLLSKAKSPNDQSFDMRTVTPPENTQQDLTTIYSPIY